MNILAIGSHHDDVEFGCFGTLSKHKENGDNVYVVDRTVDVHVRKIREKLGDHYIETVKGVGYRFKE